MPLPHHQFFPALVQNLPPSRPRVAYVITSSEIGGAQSHLADLLHALRGRIDAVVLAGGNGPLLTAAKAAGAKTVRLPLLDNALSPLKALATLRQLKAALHSAAPDLIHVHSAKAGALGRVAAWMLGIPVIYTVHGFAFKPAAPLVRRLASRVVEWCLARLAGTGRLAASSYSALATQIICVVNGARHHSTTRDARRRTSGAAGLKAKPCTV